MAGNEFSPWPSFTTEEADAVAEVLRSNRVNYWTGSRCREFEQAFATVTGTRHAVAVSNGTVALELALKALGVGPDDEVIVTCRSFVASASCVVNVGAKPVFVDVDRDSQNITPETISSAITDRTRAVICVHLAGWPCEMEEILNLARRHNLSVVEDCAQAHGAYYDGKSVGSFGDVACWSFCQDKIISTAGEGGMITTDSDELWSKVWTLKDHGKSHEAVSRADHPVGYRFVHHEFGTNARMTEISATIGGLQLNKLPEWREHRAQNAEAILDISSKQSCLRVPRPPAHISHAFYRATIFVVADRLKHDWSRDRMLSQITELGVPCFTGPCPELYLERCFKGSGIGPQERLCTAKELGETSLTFLVHPTLTQRDIGRTRDAIEQVCRLAGQ